jgi:hypothetical protein
MRTSPLARCSSEAWQCCWDRLGAPCRAHRPTPAPRSAALIYPISKCDLRLSHERAIRPLVMDPLHHLFLPKEPKRPRLPPGGASSFGGLTPVPPNSFRRVFSSLHWVQEVAFLISTGVEGGGLSFTFDAMANYAGLGVVGKAGRNASEETKAPRYC